MVWMEWNQVKDQITPACQSLIESFDIYKDLQILTSKLQFRKSCLRNFCSATLLLKSGCKNGLTLHEIGSLLYREDEDEPSVIENLLKKTEELTKLLKPDIAINLMKVKKFAVRKNSIDEWIIVDKCENENLEIEKSESNFDESTNNTFSKKDSSNEKGINLFHDEKKINKELIVDDEWIQITKPKE